MSDTRRIWGVALIVLCASYGAFRFWRMTDSCLWFDEIFSVHASEQEWGALLWFVAQDLIHPPFFYAILKLWMGIGGENLFWLRLLPIVLACLALVPFYSLCRELKLENRTIAFAVFLLAINGTFIKYAQIVRMYSLLMLLSLVSIWLFARYFNRGKNLVALIAVNVLMIYTHYYGWLVVGSEIAAILVFQRFKWRGAAVMTGILTVLFLPWLWLVSQASENGSELSQNIGWIPRPGFAEIGTYIVDLTEPFYFQASSAEPASNYFISIPLLLIFATAAALFIAKFQTLSPDEKRTIYFLGIFSFLPIVIVFSASWLLPNSIWGTRHLIIAAGPLTLLATIVFERFDQGAARTVVIIFIVLFSAYAFVLQASRPTPVYIWCAWDPIANEIESNSPGNEKVKIYTFENLVAYHLWFSTRKTGCVDIDAIEGVEGMPEDKSYFLPRGFGDVKRATINDINDEKAWLVFRTEKPGQETGLLENIQGRGYSICPSSRARFESADVYVVQIVRAKGGCEKN